MEFSELIPIPKVDNITLYTPFNKPKCGVLYISGHHLIIISGEENVEEYWILIQAIDCVEKKPIYINQVQTGGTIILKCKDFRQIRIDISNTYDFLNIYSTIERLSNLDKAEYFYPYFYRPTFKILEDGHDLFKPETEFAKLLLLSDEWRISHANKNYALCKSYSSVLIVPKNIDDDTLIVAANFREGGRFPILSYKHENGTFLLRSSQPLLNNNNNTRCRSDEMILNSFLAPSKNKGYIIDTRSINLVNYYKGKGGGTEPDGYYTQWKKIFKNFDKLVKCDGTVLEYFSRFIEACNDTTLTAHKWISRLENSHWLSYIQNILSTSCLVAQCLDKDCASVLVHGATGLDATLLITSIAQIILNPDCRTVRGLQALIEREWLQAGYPFHTRHRKCFTENTRLKHQQPTFLLFLDCVYQLHYQFPFSFEFTTQLLIVIFENSYFSNFGTFLGNSDYERNELQIKNKTISFWSYLNKPDVIKEFLNPVYEPNKAAIWPSIAPVSLALWRELYMRWTIDQNQQKKVTDKIEKLIDKDKNLRSKVIMMRKQLIEAQKEFESLYLDVENNPV